jgi:murein DD-endopeptidase MepM/ murein hydrolase activator NlpD
LIIIATSVLPTAASYDQLPEEQTLVTVDKVQFSTEFVTQYPLEKVIVSQGYSLFHPAIDFDGQVGNPVKPIRPGKVEKIMYYHFAYGNAVLIKHRGGLMSLYAHLSRIDVKEGQEVSSDTKIGEVGATGYASGDHLHLEVYDHGKLINPLVIFSEYE